MFLEFARTPFVKLRQKNPQQESQEHHVRNGFSATQISIIDKVFVYATICFIKETCRVQ